MYETYSTASGARWTDFRTGLYPPRSNGLEPFQGHRNHRWTAGCGLESYHGMLVGGDPETLTRDSTVPLVPLSVLSEWATQQASLLSTVDAKEVQCAQVVLALGGDPGDLPIGLKDEQGTTRAELNQLLTRTDEIRVFEGIEVEYDEEKDYMHSSLFNDGFAPEPEIVFITAVHPRILSVGARQWPMCLPDYTSRPGPRTPLDAFVSLIQEVWGEDFDQNIEECTVGSVDEYYEITRDVTVFSRQGRLAELDLTDLKL